jgi:hypothetical protein
LFSLTVQWIELQKAKKTAKKNPSTKKVRLRTGFPLHSKNAAAGLNRCSLVGIDQQPTVLVFGEGSE